MRVYKVEFNTKFQVNLKDIKDYSLYLERDLLIFDLRVINEHGWCKMLDDYCFYIDIDFKQQYGILKSKFMNEVAEYIILSERDKKLNELI